VDKNVKTQTKTEEPEKKFYTVGEVAKILRFSPSTVYKLIGSRKIKTIRFGNGRFRIPKNQIQAIMI